MNWFHQSPTCPQCRQRIQAKKILHKLYFNRDDDGDDDSTANHARLTNQINTLQASMQDKLRAITELKVKMATLEVDKQKLSDKCL
jgi:TRAF-interacting protein